MSVMMVSEWRDRARSMCYIESETSSEIENFPSKKGVFKREPTLPRVHAPEQQRVKESQRCGCGAEQGSRWWCGTTIYFLVRHCQTITQ